MSRASIAPSSHSNCPNVEGTPPTSVAEGHNPREKSSQRLYDSRRPPDDHTQHHPTPAHLNDCTSFHRQPEERNSNHVVDYPERPVLRQEEDGHRRCPLQGAFERPPRYRDWKMKATSMRQEEEIMDGDTIMRIRPITKERGHSICEANADNLFTGRPRSRQG